MMTIQHANIPEHLKAGRQSVVWCYEDDTKVPYNARTGRKAKSNDPATWSTHEEARTAYETGCNWRGQKYDGVGRMFDKDEGLVGVDFDNCIDEDGTIKPRAQALIDRLATYGEISPSGKGVKLWAKGNIPENVGVTKIGDGIKVEIYYERRFFTQTGQHLPGTPTTVNDADEALADLYELARPTPKDQPEQPRPLPDIKPDANHIERYVLGALRSAHECMLTAGDGERHNMRRNEAHGLAGYLWTGVITKQDIFDALDCNYGRNQKTAKKTIWDAVAVGEQKPRPIPPPRQATCAVEIEHAAVDDDLDTLGPDELRRRLRAVITERDRWKKRAQQLELQLGHVQERNRFVTQATGAEGIQSPSMRLTFIELKKELDREVHDPDQWTQVRPAYMAACTKLSRSTVSRHLTAFEKNGLIEKDVRRVFHPELVSDDDDGWRAETFVRPKVDLSDPSKIVVASEHGGKRTCRSCGSEDLRRRVYCAHCGDIQSDEPVHATEPELHDENQDADDAEQDAPGAQEAMALDDDALNCKMQSREIDSSPSPFMLHPANQTTPQPSGPAPPAIPTARALIAKLKQRKQAAGGAT
jgi:DNA-binding transcriptional ArsR family regulator